MDAGEKDSEADTLHATFKKLRVDVESLPTAVSAPEGVASRVVPRASPDPIREKPNKPSHHARDDWHVCVRKPSSSPRGASRSRTNSRSEFHILHPPTFTYGSAMAAAPTLPPPSVCPKRQRLTDGLGATEPVGRRPPDSHKEPASSDNISSMSRVSAGYDSNSAPREIPAVITRDSGSTGTSTEVCSPGEGARDVSGPVALRPQRPVVTKASDIQVYSFTELRNVISEYEKSIPAASTPTTPSSVSPRSCSEQARAYVDDITIDDLSGYMEHYLYIPRKMSHMAEMMYT